MNTTAIAIASTPHVGTLSRGTATQCEAGTACFHCGLPVTTGDSYRIRFDGKMQALCCVGCEAVAQTILDAGLAAYYRERTAVPQTSPAAPRTNVDALFYLNAIQAQYVKAQGTDTQSVDLYIDGITCSACVWLAESALAKTPGVTQASVNQVTHRATVAWRVGESSLREVLNTLTRVGLAGQPSVTANDFAARRKARRHALIELGVALLSMMQVMMFTLPLYFSAADDVSEEARLLMGWAALVLTLPAILYSARTFFSGAWRDLRNRRVSMDLPVALAITATFGASCIALFQGTGVMYFDSISMFIFLLLAARYLESWARESSLTLIERLTNAAPAAAFLLPTYPQGRDGNAVAVAALKAGQVIRIATGEMVAADGVIVEGTSDFDESLLSGESHPLSRGVSDRLMGGSLNLGGPVFMRVTRTGDKSAAAMLRALTEQALASRPRLSALSDRVARWIAPVTLGLSVIAALGWLAINPAMSFPVAVAVLAVTCPCALALAVPAAQALATTRLAREGLLIVRADTLEKIARATDIVFDKTGTITTGHIAIEAIDLLGSLDRAQVLAAATALEAGSLHPIARALQRATQAHVAGGTVTRPIASTLKCVAGAGVEGDIDFTTWRLGHQLFVQQIVGHAAPAMDASTGSLFLGRHGEWLAAFSLSDPLKADACDTIAALRQHGLTVHLLSGDRHDFVAQVAVALDIETANVMARQTPQQKLDYANSLKQHRAQLIAVGDGVNDAPLLGGADVSIAIGSGADLTRLTADAVLLSPNLAPLLTAQMVARKMVRIIHQNFYWAIAYNVIAIPLAVMGKISPAEAAIGMALSSLAVVANSLRLMRRDGPTARTH
ncbi:MAG: heavy metal translocating P-type ATPase [Burkholderiales bacterium]|nr:heavy metal translocating P-type ATPase [Burkholderiales bacterium]